MPIHSTAVVHPTASIHPEAEIGPFAVIGESVVIGARTRVGAHAVATVGHRSFLDAGLLAEHITAILGQGASS